MRTAKTIIMALCVPLLIASCNSPSKQGKKLALKENRIYKETLKQFNELTKDFTVGFKAGNYRSRQEAKDDRQSRRQQIVNHHETEINSVNTSMKLAASELDPKKLFSMQEAYQKNHDSDLQSQVSSELYTADMPQEVLVAISGVSPQQPDAPQMQNDLASRTMTDVDGGYFSTMNRLINLNEYNISEFSIVSVEKESPSEYTVKVSFSLSGKENSERRLDAVCLMRYLLPQYDDWTLDFIRTESLSIIGSETYGKCVSLVASGGWFCKDLYVKNDCDKSLEVFVSLYYSDGWGKKVVIARPQDNTFVVYGIPSEYKIDHVLPL